MLDEGDCIVKQGYLKKIKTMKKKFFVLYRDSRAGPARLEYYDTEKKFREKKSGQTARRAIMLRACFAISDTTDSRHKHGIALYTKDDCFGVGFGDEHERNEWLAAMHDLVGARRGASRTLMFEHVWDVNVPLKDLGKSFAGPYRLCLTVRYISLVKKASVEPDVTFPLEVVRRCGHSGNFFFIEVGRQSSTGEGELWMEAEDALIAQNMHCAILLAMNSNKDYDDLPPRIAPQQAVAIVGGVPQRSNSHSTDSRQSFVQSRVGGSAAGYDAALRGSGSSVRPQRSYTFSEPKRSATSQAASRGLGSLLMSMKQGGSHRPSPAGSVVSGAGSSSTGGGSYLGQDLLDRSGSSFYKRIRSDSISSRATSSSLSIDECDQGLASRSLTPDLQTPAGGAALQPGCSSGAGCAEAAMLFAADRRSPNFGGSVLSVHSSRVLHGPAFDCQKTNTSSVSSLSGSSLDDPYLDMAPAGGGAARSVCVATASYVAMMPSCSSSARGGGSGCAGGSGSDSYSSIMPAVGSMHQEGYVEMCPAASAPLGNDPSRGCGSAAQQRLVRPDLVRSYLRDVGAGGDDSSAERSTQSRRSSVSGQISTSSAVPAAAAGCSPYVDMSCSSGIGAGKVPTSSSLAAAAALAGSPSAGQGGGSTPRSLATVASAAVLSSDPSALSSPRSAAGVPRHERAGSAASVHDGPAGGCTTHSNPQSPRFASPDLWSQKQQPPPPLVAAACATQQLQADLFMEMDFDRPRTASDTFCNRPRTCSISSSVVSAHRPRSSSHGQNGGGKQQQRIGGCRTIPAAAAAAAAAAPRLSSSSRRPSAAASSSAGSSRESTSSSLLGSSNNYLDMAAAAGGGGRAAAADYMDMAFDDRKPKAWHQQRQHQHPRGGNGSSSGGSAGISAAPQVNVAMLPHFVGAGGNGGHPTTSSQESLEVCMFGGMLTGAAAPLSPGDYVGIDFSKGFERRIDAAASTADSASISPIPLRGSGGLQEQCGGAAGCWDLAEPFPELSSSSSGEDVNSCRSTRRQPPAPFPPTVTVASHTRSSSSCSLAQSLSSSASRRAPLAAGAGNQQPSTDGPSAGQQQQHLRPVVQHQQARVGTRMSPPTVSASVSAQRVAAAAAYLARTRCSAPPDGAGPVLGHSPAGSECYEEMGPGGGSGSRSGFGLTPAAPAAAAAATMNVAAAGASAAYTPSPPVSCGADRCGGSGGSSGSTNDDSQGSVVTMLDDRYGDTYAAVCPQSRHDATTVAATGQCAPMKGVSYIRQTSRESLACVPRPAVCYIRADLQSEECRESWWCRGSDEDDGVATAADDLCGGGGGGCGSSVAALIEARCRCMTAAAAAAAATRVAGQRDDSMMPAASAGATEAAADPAVASMAAMRLDSDRTDEAPEAAAVSAGLRGRSSACAQVTCVIRCTALTSDSPSEHADLAVGKSDDGIALLSAPVSTASTDASSAADAAFVVVAPPTDASGLADPFALSEHS